MRWLLLAALLSACGAAPPMVSDVTVRNPAAPVASQADVTSKRLAGNWVVVESSEELPGTPARIERGSIRIGTKTRGFADAGQGRFTSEGGQIWVHWLDADNRTVALGDPEGQWVAILDRNGRPGERRRAAREILSWYGYDLSRMRAQER